MSKATNRKDRKIAELEAKIARQNIELNKWHGMRQVFLSIQKDGRPDENVAFRAGLFIHKFSMRIDERGDVDMDIKLRQVPSRQSRMAVSA